jgi:hypothetical protein
MTEQQQHLKTCLENLQKVVGEIRELEAQLSQRREMATKMQGIIEYLQGTGVTLEEASSQDTPPEETKASSIKTKDA